MRFLLYFCFPFLLCGYASASDGINRGQFPLHPSPISQPQSSTGIIPGSSLSFSGEVLGSEDMRQTRVSFPLYQQTKNRNETPSFFRQYAWQILFSGLLAGSAAAVAIFDSQARSQYKNEREAYDAYRSAGTGSDFDALWARYTREKQLTNRYITIRGISGIASGAFGLSLIFAFALETD
jgi:hypothetical protein